MAATLWIEDCVRSVNLFRTPLMFRTLLLTASLALAWSTAPLAAQTAPSLAGRWNIEWELGRIIQNDDVRIIKATGTLSVVPSGDSLLASFEVKSRSDGAPLPKPFTLSGRANGDGATFLQRQEARLNMNGEEMVRQVKVTWNLRATGDTLTGDMQREIEGLMMGSGDAAPVTGSRVKP